MGGTAVSLHSHNTRGRGERRKVVRDKGGEECPMREEGGRRGLSNEGGGREKRAE